MKKLYLIHKILFVLLILLLGCKQPKQEKPNFLFIVADDLGYSDLACMGSGFYETPNIDALASRSMIFTDGYAGCQVCSPSRATILTGQFTARHGITDWIGALEGEQWRNKNRNTKLLPPSYQHHMPKEVLTLPQALKKNGYSTFFAGKWHLGGDGFLPDNYGFDINKGGYERGGPAGGFFAPFGNPKLKDESKGENLSMRLAKETAEFMRASKDTPFLAYLSFYAVHAPIQSTKERWLKYRNKAEDIGIAANGFEEGYFLPMRKYQDNPVYAGLIESMDEAVGYVLNSLRELGLSENTVVIFTSDNGGVTSGDNYSTTCHPLKGGKGYQWEGGIRVPFIVSVPWMNLRGRLNNTPVIGSDFYPTMLDLAGLPLQKQAHLDGRSIVPVLQGETLRERPMYWHYPHYGNQGGQPVSMIRHGDWKLIYYWEDGHDELYNLVKDLHEDFDLSEEYSERRKSMRNSLFTWLDGVNAKKPQKDPNYNAEAESRTIASMKTNNLKKYEKLRRDMLDKNWEPNDNWWGSIPTID
ncbi:sulfatase [Saccharicrinis aurantiacus]|uniref:sulfatase n=1 Tax=Saccharicrinis aurantiacus TaxID=1849719 RepID=UPI00249076F1|nr:sulfatase [Saccharicrinis aurantiacus]